MWVNLRLLHGAISIFTETNQYLMMVYLLHYNFHSKKMDTIFNNKPEDATIWLVFQPFDLFLTLAYLG